jgi:uncharacterized protein (DUF1786 family)
MIIVKEVYKDHTPEERKKVLSDIIIRLCKNRLQKNTV